MISPSARLTPSVTWVCDVPEAIEESFYQGKVCVSMKNAAFQSSSPLRPAVELTRTLRTCGVNTVRKPVLLLYTDGGPDHRSNFVRVQVSLICLFKLLQLDYLVAARTAPMQSYRNLVESCMSLLNLSLQSLGLMREKMPDDEEKAFSSANSLAATKSLALSRPHFKDAYSQSLQPCITQLNDIFGRLKLHDEPIRTTSAASEDELDELWEEMQA